MTLPDKPHTGSAYAGKIHLLVNTVIRMKVLLFYTHSMNAFTIFLKSLKFLPGHNRA